MRDAPADCRVRPDIAEMVIGHTREGIVATYDRHGFEAERRAALVAWETRLVQIVAGNDPERAEADNVVRLEAQG